MNLGSMTQAYDARYQYAFTPAHCEPASSAYQEVKSRTTDWTILFIAWTSALDEVEKSIEVVSRKNLTKGSKADNYTLLSEKWLKEYSTMIPSILYEDMV